MIQELWFVGKNSVGQHISTTGCWWIHLVRSRINKVLHIKMQKKHAICCILFSLWIVVFFS